jgi:hypothetical protein
MPQEQGFRIDNFTFSFAPKILKDGSITDMGFGLEYTERLSGELRFRYTAIARNETLDGVEDSLNAINEHIFETFFLPVKYSFLNTKSGAFYVGGGAYYEYDKLTEKGFFNMPELENLTPSRERVNSYTNDFSMHIIGPLISLGARIGDTRFSMALYGGVAPVFVLLSSQKMGITPLLTPNNADYSQTTTGSPYFYANLDCVLFKYLNVALLYDFAKLQYQVIDFDDDFNWLTPKQEMLVQSFRMEASALLPFGRDLSFQIGGGFTFDSITLDKAEPVRSNRQYVILAVRKAGT